LKSVGSPLRHTSELNGVARGNGLAPGGASFHVSVTSSSLSLNGLHFTE
jgi:hypothetical protein